MKFYLIEEDHFDKILAVSRRLFTEQRMNGDEMRDAAQALDLIADYCKIMGPIDPGQIQPLKRESGA